MYPLQRNDNGGLYSDGVGFDESKWAEIQYLYAKEIPQNGTCTIKALAKEAKVGYSSARKAIKAYHDGEQNLPIKKRKKQIRIDRSDEVVIGSRLGFEQTHHLFLYHLYLENPGRPRESYIVEFDDYFGIRLSPHFITKWFHGVGEFKGTMRKASKFPNAKNSPRVQRELRLWLQFRDEVDNHKRIVFADEKPLKEIDIYGTVRRDLVDGHVPYHKMNANSRNRYNILAAVALKKPNACEAPVFKESADADLFFEFVLHLVRIEFLVPGDIFVVDNCSIHTLGENKELQEVLWEEANILMVTLPPYHPEYNPTEFVFNYLTQELRRRAMRYNSQTTEEFEEHLYEVLDTIPYNYVEKFYRKMGYTKY